MSGIILVNLHLKLPVLSVLVIQKYTFLTKKTSNTLKQLNVLTVKKLLLNTDLRLNIVVYVVQQWQHTH